MSEKETEIWKVITSILNGTGTQDQYSLLNSWLEESDGNKKTYEFLSKIKSKKRKPTEADKEDVYERIHFEIRKSRNKNRMRLLRYGNIASILVIIALSIVLLWTKTSSNVSFVETRCPFGTKSKICLSDGTIVYLNSGSILKYPSVFSSGLREVKLSGEAFFEVTPENNRKFIVSTGEINIQVYGTKFNVKNYETDEDIETTLIEGSVGIARQDNHGMHQVMKLIPNKQAVYVKQTGKLFSKSLDAELVSIWKDGKYYFEDATFESIAQKLEREFNVPVLIEFDELRKEVFTGMFDKNKSIYQILDLMKRKRDFSYKEVGDTIVITND